MGTPTEPFIVQPHTARMDGPADGTIFDSNYLDEIGDICSKLIVNIPRTGEFYCQVHAQFLNPTNEELVNFVVN